MDRNILNPGDMISQVLKGDRKYAFLLGDSSGVLKQIPDSSIECVITSPPYWKLREYDIHKKYSAFLIGNEKDPNDYVKKLIYIFNEIKRILKPDGSVWLNIGDKFHKKNLMGMPWRVAIGMQDNGWILRNDIIWDQIKGTQSPKDRMRDVYEHLFHFVKRDKYFFNADAIRIKPAKKASLVNGKPMSATGVSGVKYVEQIRNSQCLDENEKENALNALKNVIDKMRRDEIVDFRMTIRGNQRTYHSESTKVSGRAKELKDRGYFFLTMQSKGYIPSDIWRIVPEDKWRKDSHCAVFPEALLTIPIKATSRLQGIILDPFSGTGSAIAAALKLGRRGIGIELGENYITISEERMRENFNEACDLLL